MRKSFRCAFRQDYGADVASGHDDPTRRGESSLRLQERSTHLGQRGDGGDVPVHRRGPQGRRDILTVEQHRRRFTRCPAGPPVTCRLAQSCCVSGGGTSWRRPDLEGHVCRERSQARLVVGLTCCRMAEERDGSIQQARVEVRVAQPLRHQRADRTLAGRCRAVERDNQASHEFSLGQRSSGRSHHWHENNTHPFIAAEAAIQAPP